MTPMSEFLLKVFKNTPSQRNLFYQFLVAFDIAFILLLFLEFTFPENAFIRTAEIGFGMLFILELVGRILFALRQKNPIFTVWNFFDLVIIFAIFQRFLFEDIFLLHLISSLRILRSYRLIKMLLKTNNFVSRNHEVVLSTVNLLVFIFIMTAMVFTLQAPKNPGINSYVDALYFTTTTLTTTGFGDIIVVGEDGKLLAVIIMALGVGLFLKLANSIFKPSKIFYKCKSCGLKRHEMDASHCKHCGNILQIEHEG